MAVAKAIASLLGSDDPEEELIKILGSSDIARYGLPAIAGVSIKGSLQVRFGIPDTFSDIFGAPGQVVGDIYEGMRNISKGYYREGFEKAAPTAIGNISKSFREQHQGVTTRSGNPVFFGKEQIKGTSYDTFLRLLAFSPTGIAEKRDIKWAEQTTRARYNKQKSDLYKRYKRLHSKPPHKRDRNKALVLRADIRDFNQEIRDRKITRYVVPITLKSLRSAFRRMKKPPKGDRLR